MSPQPASIISLIFHFPSLRIAMLWALYFPFILPIWIATAASQEATSSDIRKQVSFDSHFTSFIWAGSMKGFITPIH